MFGTNRTAFYPLPFNVLKHTCNSVFVTLYGNVAAMPFVIWKSKLSVSTIFSCGNNGKHVKAVTHLRTIALCHLQLYSRFLTRAFYTSVFSRRFHYPTFPFLVVYMLFPLHAHSIPHKRLYPPFPLPAHSIFPSLRLWYFCRHFKIEILVERMATYHSTSKNVAIRTGQ